MIPPEIVDAVAEEALATTLYDEFAAAEVARKAFADYARVARYRDQLEQGIQTLAATARFFGADAARLHNTACFTMPGVSSETQVIALDLAGVAVSAGSACSSGKVSPSHVLAAMGTAPELARGAIRLSLGWASTEADVDRFAQAFASVMTRMRAARRSVAAEAAK